MLFNLCNSGNLFQPFSADNATFLFRHISGFHEASETAKLFATLKLQDTLAETPGKIRLVEYAGS
jgi:hypothetical protein